MSKYEPTSTGKFNLRMRIVIVDWRNRGVDSVEHLFENVDHKPIEVICQRFRTYNTLYKSPDADDNDNVPSPPFDVARSVVPIIRTSELFELKKSNVTLQDWPFLRPSSNATWTTSNNQVQSNAL